MRHLTLAIALAILSGCMFGPPKSSSPTVVVVEQVPVDNIAGNGMNVTVSGSGRFDLIVSGFSDTVTIAPHQQLGNLTISGASDDVYIGSTSTVANTVTLSGTNSVLHLPPASPIHVNVTGTGALVAYDSSSG